MKALVNRGVCSVLFCFSFSAIHAAATPETPVPLPAATVKLSGITTLFGDKRALLVVQETTPAGKAARKEYSCILVEGQSSGPIEVVEIDQQNGRVKIKNGDVESELSFARDGVQPPSAPARAPASQRDRSTRRAPSLAPSITLPESQPALVQSAIIIPEPVREVIVPQSQFIVFGRSSSGSYHSPLGYGSWGRGSYRRGGSYSYGDGYASPTYSSSSYDDSYDSSYNSCSSSSSHSRTWSSSSVACNNRDGGGWHGNSGGGRSGGDGHRGGDHNGGGHSGGSHGDGSRSSHASNGGSKSK